ncbi:hypothetical protein NRI63_002411 [Salmonella enterica]|nr:hypothetical protein [Salmonella enterica]
MPETEMTVAPDWRYGHQGHRERCLRLYEQTCRQGLTHEESMARVQACRKRWLIHAGKLLP